MNRVSYCLASLLVLTFVPVSVNAQEVEEDEHELSSDHWLTEEEQAERSRVEVEVEAPPAETVEAPVEPPMPDPPRPATCGRRARDAAASSVVRIRTGSNWGAGFVYHSPRHVVTAWSLMTLGRPVTIVASTLR